MNEELDIENKSTGCYVTKVLNKLSSSNSDTAKVRNQIYNELSSEIVRRKTVKNNLFINKLADNEISNFNSSFDNSIDSNDNNSNSATINMLSNNLLVDKAVLKRKSRRRPSYIKFIHEDIISSTASLESLNDQSNNINTENIIETSKVMKNKRRTAFAMIDVIFESEEDSIINSTIVNDEIIVKDVNNTIEVLDTVDTVTSEISHSITTNANIEKTINMRKYRRKPSIVNFIHEDIISSTSTIESSKVYENEEETIKIIKPKRKTKFNMIDVIIESEEETLPNNNKNKDSLIDDTLNETLNKNIEKAKNLQKHRRKPSMIKVIHEDIISSTTFFETTPTSDTYEIKVESNFSLKTKRKTVGFKLNSVIETEDSTMYIESNNSEDTKDDKEKSNSNQLPLRRKTKQLVDIENNNNEKNKLKRKTFKSNLTEMNINNINTEIVIIDDEVSSIGSSNSQLTNIISHSNRIIRNKVNSNDNKINSSYSNESDSFQSTADVDIDNKNSSFDDDFDAVNTNHSRYQTRGTISTFNNKNIEIIEDNDSNKRRVKSNPTKKSYLTKWFSKSPSPPKDRNSSMLSRLSAIDFTTIYTNEKNGIFRNSILSHISNSTKNIDSTSTQSPIHVSDNSDLDDSSDRFTVISISDTSRETKSTSYSSPEIKVKDSRWVCC